MAYSWLNPAHSRIRLLHLQPALSENENINCRFSIVSLNDKSHYEALSYVWGDIKDRASAEVNGCSMTITKNLHSALKHLRLKNEERVLWIDALCINQSDDLEKMHQVAKMKYIYNQASRVVVWLGEGWDGSDTAMAFLKLLGENETLHLDPTLDPCIDVNGINLHSAELRGDIIRLFSLPWWKRTWTVQEFVLAKDLVFQCSRALVTQRQMYMARENFWSHKDRCCQQRELDSPHPVYEVSVSTAFTQPARLDFITKSRGNAYSVLTAIASFSRREVTNPKDRVYGMLGLGTGPYSDLVEPDYMLSPEMICTVVAMKSVERTGTFEFLSHLFGQKNSKLPSFVPNWTGEFSWIETYGNRLNYVKFFSASLDIPAEVTLISQNVLSTKGVIFDTISAVSSGPLLDFATGSTSLYQAQELADIPSSSNDLYCNSTDSRLMAFWHSMCGGMEMVLRDSNRFSGELRGKTDLKKYYRFATLMSASSQQRRRLLDNEMSHILLDIETATQGRRFFTTAKGYFGFAPENCKEGDLVVVLSGGKVPYIIRHESRKLQLEKVIKRLREGTDMVSVIKAYQKLTFQKCYSILGDAYVHGIMYGEVFEILDENQQKLREIVLV